MPTSAKTTETWMPPPIATAASSSGADMAENGRIHHHHADGGKLGNQDREGVGEQPACGSKKHRGELSHVPNGCCGRLAKTDNIDLAQSTSPSAGRKSTAQGENKNDQRPARHRNCQPRRNRRAPDRASEMDVEPRLPTTCRTTGPNSMLPASIRTISSHSTDLRKFPFTTKQDLRDNYPYGMFAVPRSEVVRIHASSGTTGKPTVVGYTQKDIETWADLIARSIYASGGRQGDIVHIAYGYGLFTGGLGAHYGAEKLGCTVIPMSGGQTEKQVQLICDFKPDIIMVTPSYMLNIADEFRRQGIDPRSTAIAHRHPRRRTVDRCHAQRNRAAFGIDAIDIYGLSEVIGPGVANECVETKDGPVIWEDHFYPKSLIR
jgi:hypothetical protein